MASLPTPRGCSDRCRDPPLLLLLSFVEALQERLPHSLAVCEDLPVPRPAGRQLDDLHVTRCLAVGVVVGLGFPELPEALPGLPPEEPHHIRNTPKVVSGIGAFSDAASPSARTRRVS